MLSEDSINIRTLIKYLEPEAILYELLAPYNFNTATVRQIFESIISQSGKIFYSDTHKLIKDREFFIIKKREKLSVDSFLIREEDCLMSYPLQLSIETIQIDNGFVIEKNKNILYLDKDKIKFPLTLRRWHQGDWFIPFGMKGKKKVSDYFTDQKFTLFEKEEAWLLCSENDIVWIVSERSDDRFKIDKSNKQILKIQITDNPL